MQYSCSYFRRFKKEDKKVEEAAEEELVKLKAEFKGAKLTQDQTAALEKATVLTGRDDEKKKLSNLNRTKNIEKFVPVV